MFYIYISILLINYKIRTAIWQMYIIYNIYLVYYNLIVMYIFAPKILLDKLVVFHFHIINTHTVVYIDTCMCIFDKLFRQWKESRYLIIIFNLELATDLSGLNVVLSWNLEQCFSWFFHCGINPAVNQVYYIIKNLLYMLVLIPMW